MSFRPEYMETAELGNSLPQLDIRSATCHIGGDGHLPPLTGLGDNFRFPFMVLCVQDVMLDPGPGQILAQQFRLFNGDGPDQQGRPV